LGVFGFSDGGFEALEEFAVEFLVFMLVLGLLGMGKWKSFLDFRMLSLYYRGMGGGMVSVNIQQQR
jgi:hypothetical protein